MTARNRRIGVRVPLEMFLDQFWNDKRIRALSANISDTGVRVRVVSSACSELPDRSVVGLQLSVPGSDEVIWARGEVRHQRNEGATRMVGIRFTAMACAHARLLRSYCLDSRRDRLAALLARIREPGAAAAA